MKIRLVLAFFLLCLSQQTSVFAVNREFTHLTIENGLSQSTIFNIIQDKKGYLWFTTQDGLNRYDGYTFKIFRHSISDTQSISDNSLVQLFQDKKGDIWISSIHGNINHYHYKSGKFSSFYLSELDSTLHEAGLSSMVLDDSGFIWLGMKKAIGKLNTTNKKLTIYHKYSSGQAIESPHIFIDKNNNIWVGAKEGLFLFNSEKNEFEPFKIDSSQGQLVKNVITMCEDHSGRLWIGLKGHAPIQLDPQTGQFFSYEQHFSPEILKSFNNLTSILYTSTAELVIGTLYSGLYIFHPHSGSVEHLENDSFYRESLSFNHVLSLYEDRAQNLWVGTLKGLNKLDLKPKKFETFRLSQAVAAIDKNTSLTAMPNVILSVMKDSKGLIWLGTYMTGLYTIDEKNAKIRKFDITPFKGESIWAIYQISESSYLVGTNQGLNLINTQLRRSRFIQLGEKDGEQSYWVRDIAAGKDNNLWVATLDNGLLLFNTDKGILTKVPLKIKGKKGKFKSEILSLYKDHAGKIWLGTRLSGLFFYDPKSGEFSSFDFKDERLNREFSRINSIKEDREHRLWIATENGLVGIDADRTNYTHYSVQNGLLNSYIYAVEIDEIDDVWVSTNGGLSKIHINKYGASLIYNYTMKDGLQANEFNTNCSFKDGKGNLYFGGIDGLNVFNPLKIYNNPHIPVVAVNWISVDNKIISPVNKQTQVVLEPYYSNLEFNFSSLDFTNPDNNRYAYKLEGFDRDWIYCGSKHSVRYTGLKPGEYTFFVKGTNNDGLWSKSEVVKVTVLTPFWETAWARAFYVLLLILFIVLLIMARTRKVNRDKKKLDEKVKEITGELQENYRKLEETKNELINSVKRKAVEVLADGMAHDFNNLLFVILNSAQLLKNSVKKPEMQKLVKNIEVAAIDAAAVIKRIQDFSSKKEKTEHEIVDVNHVLLDAIEMLKPKIRDIEDKKNIMITIKKDIHVNWVTYGDLSEFRLAFTNILVNAVEAFDQSGRITVTSRFDGENKGVIEISDEGRGMPAEVLSNIFDPFYTTKGVHGSGLGLSQAYGIITRHNGSIKAESEPGHGTKIIITLPANPKILNLGTKTKKRVAMQQQKSSGEKSILIVEDEVTIRELYAEILSMQNYRLEMAETGEEGVAKWENGSYDLIICDLGLPGLLSGWDVIEKIRKENKEIPVLVVTGWGNTIEQEKIERYQVNKVLTKPVPMQELIKEVSEMIN